MKAPKDGRPASEQVAWVKHLPNNGGGDWGHGVTQTVVAVEADLKTLQGRLIATQAENKRREDEQKSVIRARERLLSETVKRADSEAQMLYADVQIERAKAAADIEVARSAQKNSAPAEATAE